VKAAGICISTLIVIDTFFISFAVGFNSRHVLEIDPSLPPLVQPKPPAKPAEVPKAAEKEKKSEHTPGKPGAKHGSKSGSKTVAKPGHKQPAHTKDKTTHDSN
jgi:hypothetical protein